MIHATLRFYPNQANKNGTRGVWRVLHCHEVNYVPYKPAYVVLWNTPDFMIAGKTFKVLRLTANRMYKVGSRIDPRKMLGV